MRAGSGRPYLLAATAVGCVEIALARWSADPGGITKRHFALLGVLAAMWAAFAVGAALLLRVRRTRTVVVVALALGVALRIGALSPKAPLSDDLYRYAWDGVVQTHGVDPYRYPPLDHHLASLRTSGWLFPPDYSNGTRLNRPDVRTIYPPVAEAWFTAVHLIVPLSARDRGYEAVGLLVDLAVLAVLLALLRGERRRWIVYYALCPLPVIEAVQNAHVDGLAVLLSLVAVLALVRGHGRWAALSLAAATLVKVYPALLLPVLLRAAGWRERAARLGIFAAAIVVAYVPHVLGVGIKVLGYLPGYLREEQYDAGSRYLLVGLAGLTGKPATAVVLVVLAVAVVVTWRSRLDPAAAALWLLVTAFLLVTPVQPWYLLLLAALATVTGQWAVLAVCAGAYGAFFGTILDSHAVSYGRLGYGLSLLLILAVLGLRYVRNGAVANSVMPAEKATLAS